MKRKLTSRTSASATSTKVAKNVDAYLADLPEPSRTTLAKVRAVIRASVPQGAVEKISYGMPMFHHGGMVVGFAAFSKHCSLFPGPGVIEAFKDELKSFPTSKGTIRFPADKPFPAALLKKLVAARLKELERKKRR